MASSKWPGALRHRLPRTMGEAIAAEQRASEILVGWVQMLVLAVFAGLYVAAPKMTGPDIISIERPVDFVPAVLTAYFAFTLLRLWLAYRGRVNAAMAMLSVVVDMLLLLGLIWSFHLTYHQPPSFYLKAPAFAYIFIFIALRTLRFDPWPVALAGVTGIAGWLLMVVYAVGNGGEITRSFVHYATSNAIMIGGEVDKMVTLLSVTGILVVAVLRGRRLLTRQIAASGQVARLNRELLDANAELRQEVARRVAYEHKLEYDGYHDSLTGLANRAALRRRLADRPADGPPCTVAVLDIDRFRLINNGLGHAAGDATLAEIGRRLNTAVRGADMAVRLGNDEFALLLDCDGDTAARILDRIRADLARPFTVAGTELTGLTVCCGYADTLAAALTDLPRNAEIALDRAKHAGSDSLRRFEPAQRSDEEARRRIEHALPGVIARGELHLAYQPIVEAGSGRISGFEALLRWRHPALGMISPAQFIPLAEATGQIHALGGFVIEEAIAQLARWRREQGVSASQVTMAINVSTRQFDRGDELIAVVEAALRRHHVPPQLVKLEITESLLLEEPERALRLLDRIAAHGVRLAIDDFGTGYSSFSLLRRLPASTLKIDRAFLERIDSGGPGREIVKAIVGLARRLGMDTVAEGVETPRQHEILAAIGCTALQGFLFAPPQPAEQSVRWLQAGDAVARSGVVVSAGN